MSKTSVIRVQNIDISIRSENDEDYICLTDMVKNLEGSKSVISHWLSTKSTVEFLGVWEQLNNPNFNYPEFGVIKNEAGSNKFVLTVKRWCEKVEGIGIKAKTGRYGGTYAHKDIAFEFGSWISPEFKLLLIKEFQRLKAAELDQRKLQWDYRRFLTKVNYKIQTDSVKEHLIPKAILPKNREWLVYAEEADILNVALFGQTAASWREANPELAAKGENIRDHASIEQLTVLSNLEGINAHYISKDIEKEERFEQLVLVAQQQMKSLMQIKNIDADRASLN